MTKEQKTIKEAIRYVRKNFNKPCKEKNWDCANCKGNELIAGLEWYQDLLKDNE
ncbi:MAG: hypothetical protein Q7R65_01270 [bacterium]|nr:hypothetical protein [bacterium]